MSPEPLGHARHRLTIISLARGDPEPQQLARIIDHQMQLAAK
jgi:hypothetical protein